MSNRHQHPFKLERVYIYLCVSISVLENKGNLKKKELRERERKRARLWLTTITTLYWNWRRIEKKRNKKLVGHKWFVLFYSIVCVDRFGFLLRNLFSFCINRVQTHMPSDFRTNFSKVDFSSDSKFQLKPLPFQIKTSITMKKR